MVVRWAIWLRGERDEPGWRRRPVVLGHRDDREEGQLSLPDRPGGEVRRIVGVVLGGLGVMFRCLDVELVALAVDAVMEVLHLRSSVHPDRLPLAWHALGGLPSRFAGRLPAGSDVCLDLFDACLDLLAGSSRA